MNFGTYTPQRKKAPTTSKPFKMQMVFLFLLFICFQRFVLILHFYLKSQQYNTTTLLCQFNWNTGSHFALAFLHKFLHDRTSNHEYGKTRIFCKTRKNVKTFWQTFACFTAAITRQQHWVTNHTKLPSLQKTIRTYTFKVKFWVSCSKESRWNSVIQSKFTWKYPIAWARVYSTIQYNNMGRVCGSCIYIWLTKKLQDKKIMGLQCGVCCSYLL